MEIEEALLPRSMVLRYAFIFISCDTVLEILDNDVMAKSFLLSSWMNERKTDFGDIEVLQFIAVE